MHKADVSGFTFAADQFEKQGACEAVKYLESDIAFRASPELQKLLGGFLAILLRPTGGDTDAGPSTVVNIEALPSSCAEQVERDACRRKLSVLCKQARHKQKPLCVSLSASPPKFAFTTRSLDTMIYYLGEMQRAREGDSQRRGLKIWVEPGQSKQMEAQALFAVEEGGWFGEPAVQVRYRDADYRIPQPCIGTSCAPDDKHRSLQVLTLLNQIWGLQKEAAEAPTVPVVSVINSQ